MMKPTLQVRLGQQLTLTPQLRQAIRLLQLSAVELDLEINLAVDSNPLLEREEDAQGDLPDAPAPETAGESADSDPTEELPELRWDEADSAGARSAGREDEDHDEGTAAPLDLCEHLAWQLRLSHLGPRDRRIGEALIESIDNSGYLSCPFEDIQAALKPDIVASSAEIETVLHLIQHFDPVGVGARSLSECLGIQLGILDRTTPGLELAREIAARHLDALARTGPERLAAQLQKTPADMAEAVALLRSLDPKPGSRISSDTAEFIVPDAIAYRRGGVWKVVAAGSPPQLRINRQYERLIGSASRDDDNYLRAQLQEARWLIKSLETRADTLLRVAKAIVRQQSGFLEHGAQAMRPLTLREVADELGLHESTISRATTHKYLRTPRGTFEFKYFFGSGIATDSGGDASATAIQAMLRRLIGAENPRTPLSDAKLADLLKGEGIPVARRTVAKYREAMNIPSSNERQRL
jgi:RNA polymerase sigma-54 factor